MRLLAIGMIMMVTLGTNAAEEDPVQYQVIESVALSKVDIYRNSLIWITDSFRSARKVIDFKDEDLGIITVRGNLDLKIGWGVYMKFDFEMKIEAKDERYRLTFSDVRGERSGAMVPVEQMNRSSLEPDLLKSFEEISLNFASGLLSAASDDEW